MRGAHSKRRPFCLGTILAAPFAFYHDLMLAPAIAFYAADGLARGFGPWEKTALAALWLMPLPARSAAQITLIPIGVPVMRTFHSAAASQHVSLPLADGVFRHVSSRVICRIAARFAVMTSPRSIHKSG
jgi:hypothetical protein